MNFPLYLICYCLFVYTGGDYEGVYYDDILRYDSAGDVWEDAGKMNFPRSQHAVATLEDISQFCN